ncbi:hypothetical protein KKE92_01475 [Candidatus Micrarchaeota archaeon]|nr:hypothetical protein [Candidatus Micrarchaeota archaeon]MBU1681506.1 hypothetical protein [Candidatus Micrarchaeota archaeon]
MKVILLAILLLLAGCTSTEQSGNENTVVEEQNTASDDQNTQSFDIDSCLSECDGLKGSILNICQASCHQDNAIALENPEKCKVVEDLMNSTAAHAVCLEEVALKIGDASPCENLENEFDRDLCYITVAEDLGDISICEKVSSDGNDPLDKQSCLNKLG